MKPCRAFKKQIALAAVGSDHDPVLAEHLADCEACRTYAAEIGAIAHEHMQRANQLAEAEMPFRTRSALAKALSRRNERSLVDYWPWVAAGTAVTVAIVLSYLQWSAPRTARNVTVVSKSPQVEITVKEPSYAVYHSHLARSSEDLELALSRYDSPPANPGQPLKLSSQLSELP
jgi:predicted anti-sigma-YlaC factor YlaD